MCKISSNGGLVLIGNMQNSLAWQIGQLIPDSRKNGCIVGQQHYNHGIRKRPQARTESFVPMCHKTGS